MQCPEVKERVWGRDTAAGICPEYLYFRRAKAATIPSKSLISSRPQRVNLATRSVVAFMAILIVLFAPPGVTPYSYNVPYEDGTSGQDLPGTTTVDDMDDIHL